MTPSFLYALTGIALFLMAVHGFLARRHLVRKIIALNIMGGGVFLVLIAMASRGHPADPVPQAMVITGIVVAVAMTALALAVLVRLHEASGSVVLDPPEGPPDRPRSQQDR